MPYTLPQGFESYFREWENRIGAFIEFDPAKDTPVSSIKDAVSGVSGLPFAVKDNISVQGFGVSCGSKLLANVRAPYTATAVSKLLASGAIPVGKTNLDEFGMGSSTDNSGIKKTNNPWDVSRVPGGSSGGSAAAVAAGLAPFALGSDTGGSVRQPAAFCGVAGLKPTYGAVSRFGLVAYASSLEVIGILSDTISRCRDVFSIIKGADPLDETSHNAPKGAPGLDARNGIKGGGKGVIGVLSPEAVAKAISAAGDSTGGSAGEAESLKIAAQAAELEPEVRKGFEAAKKNLSDLGYTLKDVELPSLKYGVPAYYTIATAEASANLARFDSIRYGKRPDWAENPDDLIDKAREAGFGAEVKLRILLGTFVLRSGFQDRYYLRAQKIRAGIRLNFEALLGDSDYNGPAGACDAILLPVFPTRAFDRGPSSLSPFAQKAADLYTCCANLAGLPALSFPASVEGGLPVGVQLIGRAFAEGTLLNIAEDYEGACPFPHPAGYRAFWK
ncbi:amidase family protein [Leadbettera azotonutricia]|uniref:Glutamyl-tRNA(Gln) amidotransferase subunit A n=1 Tax=Leadbettera azotonutricia (strain ATCC BAA-888 / DSM 13862 / ZAS-9) TaxID=545695 RepID=F5YFJ5_LEAAZ|nr:amidase family protein [Leadbettera azotonutricia]AEF82751.1 glutamyl-tRNA(Gln) and/or aspartyl-tRNA(Asn) amidotransferase, A subunit [Leadbettera azotonutricia ZAS-9]